MTSGIIQKINTDFHNLNITTFAANTSFFCNVFCENPVPAEAIFQIAKNTDSDISRRLQGGICQNLYSNNDIIKLLRIVKKDIPSRSGVPDIYAPPHELETNLQVYKACIKEGEFTEEELFELDNKKLKLGEEVFEGYIKEGEDKAKVAKSKHVTYKELKDIENGDFPPITEANESFQPTAFFMKRDIIYAYITQSKNNSPNFDELLEFVNMEKLPFIEQSQAEVLTEEDKKDRLLTRRAWESVHTCLRKELAENEGRIAVRYGFSKQSIERLKYPESNICNSQMVFRIAAGFNINMSFMLILEKENGKYTKVTECKSQIPKPAMKTDSKPKPSSVRKNKAHVMIPKTNVRDTTIEEEEEIDTSIPVTQYTHAKRYISLDSDDSDVDSDDSDVDSADSDDEVVYSSEDESEESYTFPSRLTEFEGSESYKVVLVSDKHSAIEFPVDAMVCETDTELKNPHKGSISIDILKAAGKKVKEECKNKPAENSLEHGKKKCHPGEVIKTGSGDLIKKNGTTRVLMHTTTLPMDGRTRRHQYSYARTGMLLQTSYENILVTTSEHNNAITMSAGNENRIHSVFIPLLGTENGHTVHASVGYLSNAIQKHGRHLKDQGVMVVVGCRTAEEVTEVQNSIQRS